MAIDKQEFVEILAELKEAREIEEKINDLMNNSIVSEIREAHGICMPVTTHEGKVVRLLEEIFDTDMVGYWVYDLNFGKYFKEGCCQETINDVVVNVQIATAEELYDYITRGK